MIRRPPRPTRFPSTTLFESHVGPQHSRDPGLAANPSPLGPQGPRATERDPSRLALAPLQERRDAAHRHPAVAALLALDRKSTRLNSRHANISYGVFCLEKKN